MKETDTMDNFDNKMARIDKEIHVNGITYILVGIIDFDVLSGKYSTNCCDYGDSHWYRMVSGRYIGLFEDSNFKVIEDNSLVFVMYAQKEAMSLQSKGPFHKFEDIPQSIKSLLQEFNGQRRRKQIQIQIPEGQILTEESDSVSNTGSLKRKHEEA